MIENNEVSMRDTIIIIPDLFCEIIDVYRTLKSLILTYNIGNTDSR